MSQLAVIFVGLGSVVAFLLAAWLIAFSVCQYLQDRYERTHQDHWR